MPDFLVTSFSPTTSLSNSESWLQVESDIDGESAGVNTYTVQTPDLQPDVTWQYDNSVYHLFKEGKSWAEAKVSAEMIGGYLVEIDSIDENNQLFAKVIDNLTPLDKENTIGADGGKAPYLWLGGTDGDTTSTQESSIWNWKWDHSNIEIKKDRIEWGKGWGGEEPDNSQNFQHRLALGLEDWSRSNPGKYGVAGQWNDINADNQLFYVVEINQSTEQLITTTQSSIDLFVEAIPSAKSLSEGEKLIWDLRTNYAPGTKLYWQVFTNAFSGPTSEVADFYDLETLKGYLVVDSLQELKIEQNIILDELIENDESFQLGFSLDPLLDDVLSFTEYITIKDKKVDSSTSNLATDEVISDLGITNFDNDSLLTSPASFPLIDIQQESNINQNTSTNLLVNINQDELNIEEVNVQNNSQKLFMDNLYFDDNLIYGLDTVQGELYPKDPNKNQLSREYKFEFSPSELASIIYETYIEDDKYTIQKIRDVTLGNLSFDQNNILQSAEFTSKAYSYWVYERDQKTGVEEITTQYSLYQSSKPIVVNDINSSESITDAMEQIDSEVNKVINFQIPSTDMNDIGTLEDFKSYSQSKYFENEWYLAPISKRLISDDSSDQILNGATNFSKVYLNQFSDYKFYNLGNGKYEIETPTGSNDITGMSELTFTNGTNNTDDDITLNISKDIKGTFDQITGKEDHTGQMFRLYNAAFARFPDAGGLAYWIDVFGSGTNTKRQVANSFLGSEEFAERYGANVSDSLYVDTLYTNVLGRLPDVEGKAYWLGQLSSGRETRAEALLGFAESSENKELFSDMTGVF